jgi:hypothetical protein
VREKPLLQVVLQMPPGAVMGQLKGLALTGVVGLPGQASDARSSSGGGNTRIFCVAVAAGTRQERTQGHCMVHCELIDGTQTNECCSVDHCQDMAPWLGKSPNSQSNTH